MKQHALQTTWHRGRRINCCNSRRRRLPSSSNSDSCRWEPGYRGRRKLYLHRTGLRASIAGLGLEDTVVALNEQPGAAMVDKCCRRVGGLRYKTPRPRLAVGMWRRGRCASANAGPLRTLEHITTMLHSTPTPAVCHGPPILYQQIFNPVFSVVEVT